MLLAVASLLLRTAAAEPPSAEAGLGLIAYVGDTVELNGTGSSDPENDPLVFAWTQVGGPPVVLEATDTAKPRFAVDAPGTLRFALVVNDGATDSAPDVVAVVVPHQDIEGVATSGCAVVPGVPGVAFAGALVACLARRRR